MSRHRNVRSMNYDDGIIIFYVFKKDFHNVEVINKCPRCILYS